MLLISPHNDDETLFCFYTISIYRPKIVILYDSYIQVEQGYPFADKKTRRAETIAASAIFGVHPKFLGLDDRKVERKEVLEALEPFEGEDRVFAPAAEIGGNRHHNLVGEVCLQMFGNRLTRYMTYTSEGKSVGSEVIPTPAMIAGKHQAMACYASQLFIPGCQPHFTRDIREYWKS